jgi:hypothetical protein
MWVACQIQMQAILDSFTVHVKYLPSDIKWLWWLEYTADILGYGVCHNLSERQNVV